MGKTEKRLGKMKSKHKPQRDAAFGKKGPHVEKPFVLIERVHISYVDTYRDRFATEQARAQHMRNAKHQHDLRAHRYTARRKDYSSTQTFELITEKEPQK